jgi:hypothetical protein
VIVASLVSWVAIAPGIDPIHPGIVLVVNMEIGIITPPVGLNLFVILITCVPWLSTLAMGPGIVTCRALLRPAGDVARQRGGARPISGRHASHASRAGISLPRRTPARPEPDRSNAARPRSV